MPRHSRPRALLALDCAKVLGTHPVVPTANLRDVSEGGKGWILRESHDNVVDRGQVRRV